MNKQEHKKEILGGMEKGVSDHVCVQLQTNGSRRSSSQYFRFWSQLACG